MLTLLACLAAALLAACYLAAIKAFDRVVMLERSLAPDRWRLDGQPGTLMAPDWAAFSTSATPSRRAFFSWLLRTPDWITEVGAVHWLKMFRISLASAVGAAVAFSVLVTLS
jgi:hypothetical protein